MQLPEGRRTLAYTMPFDPSNSSLFASACEEA
jgi:hypothetical protein